MDRDTETSRETYRSRAIHWIFWVIVLVLVPGFVLGLTYLLLDKDPWAPPFFYGGFIVWAVIFAFALDGEILPMWRTMMVVDARGLQGHTGRFRYEVFWIEIVAATLFGGPSLWAATRKYVLQIPLRHLNSDRIWRRVREHLEPERVGYTAYEGWLEAQGFYEQLSEANAELIQSAPVPIRTRRKTMMTVVAWIGVLVLGSCSVCSLSVDAGAAGIVGLVFSAFPALLLSAFLFPSTVEMDLDGIVSIIPFLGRYGIRWDEIERIEHTSGMERLVFYGGDKCVPIVGPSRWGRRHGPTMWAFLQAQVEQRQIVTRRNSAAGMKVFPRNAHLRRVSKAE